MECRNAVDGTVRVSRGLDSETGGLVDERYGETQIGRLVVVIVVLRVSGRRGMPRSENVEILQDNEVRLRRGKPTYVCCAK